MNPLGLILCLHHTWPTVATDAGYAQAFSTVWAPLLAAVEAEPAVRVSWYWTGGSLKWLADNERAHLEQLLALVAAGRVEPVGGPWAPALLSTLPERDVLGQVQALSRLWQALSGRKPKGAFLPWFAWDPSLARVLGRAGFLWSVIEEEQLHPPEPGDGYVLTEREGQALALFVAAGGLGRGVPQRSPASVLRYAERRARAGARCLVVPLSLSALGLDEPGAAWRTLGGDDAWLPTFFREIAARSAWLKPTTFGVALERMRPVKQAWPPASVTMPLGLAALGGDDGTALGALFDDAERHGGPTLMLAARYARAGRWENLLEHHPEIQRLHKRMLRASMQLARLKAELRAGRGERDSRFAALEEATLSLYEGQGGDAFVLGTGSGHADGAVRAMAWGQLARAHRMATLALGEGDHLAVEQLDYDCDGRAEILVSTPTLGAIVAPAVGGALVGLDLWPLPGNVLNVRTRSREPEHEEIRRADGLPFLVPDAEELPLVELSPQARVEDLATDLAEDDAPPRGPRPGLAGLAHRLHLDRHVRASFLDRFLGPATTLDNLHGGAHPEQGDFVGADYQVLKVDEGGGEEARLTLARDGQVHDGETPRLVRVVKQYTFVRDEAVVDVSWEVSNRLPDPARGTFATEVNLNIDSWVGPEVWLDRDGSVAGVDVPGFAPEVRSVALVDSRRGLRLELLCDPPAQLYHYPIETVGLAGAELGLHHQGVCVVLAWPCELWGLERRRYTVSFRTNV